MMDATLVISFMLVLTRVGSFFAFVPLPGGKNGPDAVRVVLALGFTLALFPEWPALHHPPSPGWLVASLASELALGATIGLGTACVSEALLVTAQVVGLQAGYGYASTIDPNTQADASVLLVLAELIAGLLFFTMGLDREILRALARSLERHPPGSYAVTGPAVAAMVQLSAGIFSTGLRLALPVVALLALVDVALALVGRLNTQLQLVTLAFPAKMLAALAMLAVLAALVPRLYGALARQMLGIVERLVAQ